MNRRRFVSSQGRVLARRDRARAGFGVAPILYMLGLIGVGAGTLFSGYSQSIKNNISIGNVISVKNDLEAASSTLAATSVLNNDGSLLCPPNLSGAADIGATGSACPTTMPISLQVIPASTDARVPGFPSGSDLEDYVTSGTNTPEAVGVFLSSAGVKQIDPWGRYYIVCRWNNSPASSDPAFQIISAGPNGVINTKCGDAPATGSGNYGALMNAASAVNRASIWQVTPSGTTTVASYSATGVTVDSAGNLTVPGNLNLTGGVGSGVTLTDAYISLVNGALNLTNGALTLTNGSVFLTSGNLTMGTGDISTGGAISAASGTFSGALSAGASLFSVDATGNLAIGVSGTPVFSVAADTGDTSVLGTVSLGTSTATTEDSLNTYGQVHIGTTLLTTGTPLPYLSVGSPVLSVYPFFVDQAGRLVSTAVTTGSITGSTASISGAASVGDLTAASVASTGSVSAASATITGTVTAGSYGDVSATSIFDSGDATIQGNLTVVGSITGGTVEGADLGSVTGVLSMEHGGTGTSITSGIPLDLLNYLGGRNASNLNAGTLAAARLPQVFGSDPGGPYNQVYVDQYGRVTAVATTTPSIIDDEDGDSISLSGNVITFTINSIVEGVWNVTGLTIGSSTLARSTLDLGNNTDALILPVGTTGEQPTTSATVGMLRYNTTTNSFEGYQGDPAGWAPFAVAGTSQWITSGSNIYYSSGNVGIGTSSPSTALEVVGTITATTFAGSGSGLTDIGAGSITGVVDPAHGGTGTSTVFTQGSVVFAGPTGIYAQDNANFYWDDANNRLGIGTTGPVSSMQVATGGLFSVTGTYGSGDTLPAGLTGAGTRAFFYPRKAAFRAGYVAGTGWDDGSVGAHSVAMGNSPTASGEGSVALGWYSVASGGKSFSVGQNSTASGSGSAALGYYTTASGSNSSAFGSYTTAASYANTAIGQYNVGGGTAGSWVATDPIFEIGIGTQEASRANAVTVLKNGSVGIGTATPHASSALHVYGTLYVQGGSGVATTNINSNWIVNTSNLSLNSGTLGALIFSTGSEAMRITSSGSVGIGTATPANTLDVTGTGIRIGSGVPGTTTYSLYNDTGTLYWNGTAIASGSGGWTGATITVPYGGTGQTSLTQHGVMIGNGTNAINVTAAGSTGTVFQGVTGSDPAFSANLTYSGIETNPLGTDYTTTGAQSAVALGTSSSLRYAGTAAATFYGLAGGANGKIIRLHNASDYTLTLSNQSGSEATAGNRVITGTGADLPIPTNTSVTMQYDGSSSRWRVTGSSNSAMALAAGSDTQVQYNDGGMMAGATGLVWDKTNSRLGLGTATPAEGFEMASGNVFAVRGTYGSGDTLTLSGAGTRAFFYPRKAAFRAGYVNGTQWNDLNIGGYSTAMGASTIASGDSSTAMGGGTTASGNFSTAMGAMTTASGYYSTAMGVSTAASGDISTAMGLYTTSGSYANVAIGRYNVGGGTTDSWVATDPLFEIGIGTGAANKANAVTVLKNGNVGIGTATPGYKVHVVGTDTTYLGYFNNTNTSSGRGVYASGLYGVWASAAAIGVYATASDASSIGLRAASTGASGYGVYALGNGASGVGVYGEASSGVAGKFSTTSGYSLIATGGNVGIGTATPANTLDVTGTGIRIGSGVPGTTTYSLYNDTGTLYWNGTAIASGSGGWTGATITVPYGGTGQTSLTQHGVMIGNGTNAINVTAAGSTGTVFQGVTGSDPAFSANLTYSGIETNPLGTDYTTTGAQSAVALGTSSSLRYAGTAAATFYGLAGGANGKIIRLHNASDYTLTLSNQSGSEATAGNRVITGTGADLPIPTNTSVTMQYDATASRWRVTGSSNSAMALAAGSDTQVQYNDGGMMAGATGLVWDKTNARVGIGTATPAEGFEMASGDVFAVTGTYGAGDTLTLSGAGTRAFFYPRKAAFRAGYIDSTQWNDANIGGYSVALGYKTTASAIYSLALGFATTASGLYAVAMGNTSIASGNYSIAMGSYTKAEARADFAIGQWNVGGGTADSWVLTDPIFEIGIGTQSASRANAVTVLKNGNVGIGTTTPVQTLQVAGPVMVGTGSCGATTGGSIQYTGGVLQYCDGTSWTTLSSASGTISGSGTTNYLAKFTGATSIGDSALIESSGNVGIGTASPNTTLTVYNGNESTTLTDFTQALTKAGINIVTDLTDTAYTPGLFWSTANNNATKPKAGIWMYETATGSSLQFGTSNTYATGITNTAMVIDAGGAVGIGTTILGNYRFTVESTDRVVSLVAGATTGVDSGRSLGIRTTGDSYDRFLAYSSGSFGFGSGAAYRDVFLGRSAANTLQIGSSYDLSGSAHLLVSGNLGVGTTAPNGRVGIVSTGTTGNSVWITSNALTTGTSLDVSSTSTAGGASGSSYMQKLTRSGANANSSHTAYGLYSTVTNTGTTSTNVAGYLSASGATNNYGLIVANGNVGIGTTTPGLALDVVGSIKASTAVRTLSLMNITTYLNSQVVMGSTGTEIRREVADANPALIVDQVDASSTGDILRLQAASTTKVAVTYDGKVGIGTATPVQTLQVAGPVMVGTGSCGATTGGSIQYTGGALQYCNGTSWVTLDSGGGSVSGSGTTNYLAKFTGATSIGDSALIESSGNVGIGTASPNTTLTVYNGNESTTLTDFTQALTKAGINIVTDLTDTAYTPGLFWSTANDNATKPKAGIWMYETATGSSLQFGTSDTYATGITNTAMTITSAGRVGIGSTSPVSSLHVATGGLVSVTGTYGSGDTLPAGLTGAGTRAFFYPRKAAFRAGAVDGTEWDDANIGIYSVVLGDGGTASAERSFASGWDNVASGIVSTAMGSGTTASNSYSTAMGVFTSSGGYASTAMGDHTAASASYSTAMGSYTTASGQYSTAMGFYSTASGLASVAMGRSTGSGNYSASMGYDTTADAYTSTAIGRYNVGGGTAASWVTTDPVFEVGIGASSGSKANALTVLKNGNVGIGTATPSAGLHVVNAATTGNVVTVAGNSITTGTVSSLSSTSTAGGASGASYVEKLARSGANANSSHTAYGLYSTVTNTGTTSTNVAGYLSASGATNNYGLIVANGNVGIGTTTPVQTLQVAGPVMVGTGSCGATTGGSIQYTGGVLQYCNGTSWTTLSTASGGVSGSGTTNYLAKFTSASELGDSTLIESSGNVGIGTASPNTTLTVYNGNESTTLTDFTQALTKAGINIVSDYTDTAYTPGLFWSTANNNATKPKAGIWMYTTSTGASLQFGTSGTFATGITNTAMTIDSSGKLGIGTTAPFYRVDAFSTTDVVIRAGTTDNTGSYVSAIQLANGDGTSVTSNVAALGVLGGEAKLRFMVASNAGASAANFAAATRMTIDNAGKVGIGTATPASTLDVLSAATTANGLAVAANSLTTGAVSSLSSTSTAGGASGVSYVQKLARSGANANASHTAYGLYSTVTNTGTTSTNVAGYLSASGATNNYGLIVAAGNVGIGTTAPVYPLSVHANNGTLGGYFYNEGVGGTGMKAIGFYMGAYGYSLSGTGVYGYSSSGGVGGHFQSDVTGYALVTTGGNVGIGTTTPVQTLQVAGPVMVGTGSCGATTGGSIQYTGGVLQYCNGTSWTTLASGGGGVSGSGTANYLAKFTDASTIGDSIIIESSGKIGLGTATPLAPLSVWSSDASYSSYILNSAGGNAIRAVSSTGLAIYAQGGDRGIHAISGGTGAVYGRDSVSGFGGKFTSDTGYALITVDGNVGIGTETPSGSKFNVYGNVSIGTSYVGTGAPANGAIIQGNVGIGTSSAAARLQVASTATTGNGLAVVGNSITTGTVSSLSSTSTAGGASGASYVEKLARSGANANSSHTAYGLYSTVTNTGTTSTNVAGYLSASGATNNYGLIVANGNVGIGTTTPGLALDVVGSIKASTAVRTLSLMNITTYLNSQVVMGSTGTEIRREVADANPALVVDQIDASSTGDILRLEAASTTKVVVTYDGDVGIGTATPANTLDVTGTGIYIGSGVPGTTTNSLYNDGGTLYWNGSSLGGSGGGVSGSGTANYLAKFTSASELGDSTIIESSGNIGIGTATPSEDLHMATGGVFAVTGTTGSGDTLTLSGAGVKMFFYPRKGALRAGYLDSEYSTYWNDASIGNYSAAFGSNTRATNTGAAAFGDRSLASGSSGFATGTVATASGQGSFASGQYPTASGFYAAAFGHYTTSSANYSMALGQQTRANSFVSLAIGRYNVGGGTTNSWVETDPLFEIGIGTDSSARVNAMTVLKNGNVGIGTATPKTLLQVMGPIATSVPVTVADATYTVATTDSSIICNRAGTITLTLPTASDYPGRILNLKTIAAYTVVSDSSNVVPLTSATAGTAILAATAGKWAMLQSDGTNWVIMQGN